MRQFIALEPESLSIYEIKNCISGCAALSRGKEKAKALPTELVPIHDQMDALFDELAARNFEIAQKLAFELGRNEAFYTHSPNRTMEYFVDKERQLGRIKEQLSKPLFPEDLLETIIANARHTEPYLVAKHRLFANFKQIATSAKHTREDRKFFTLQCLDNYVRLANTLPYNNPHEQTLREMANTAYTLVAKEICTERGPYDSRHLVLDEDVMTSLHLMITTPHPLSAQLSAKRALGEIYEELSTKELKAHMKRLYAAGKPNEAIHEVAQNFRPFSLLTWDERFKRLEKITRPSNWIIVGRLFTLKADS